VHAFIAWCGFFGGWLLVAGPLRQATLELEEEDFEQEAISVAKETVAGPRPISVWWWLLPPVAYFLQRQRSDEYRRAVIAAMPADQQLAFGRFHDKAATWMLVAAGAALIAVSETWELHEASEWSELTFWILTVVMGGICIGNAIAGARRRHRRERAADATAGAP
jgi:hypothetical protein